MEKGPRPNLRNATFPPIRPLTCKENQDVYPALTRSVDLQARLVFSLSMLHARNGDVYAAIGAEAPVHVGA